MTAAQQEPMPEPLDDATLELWRTELVAVYRSQGSTWLAEEDNELRLIATIDKDRLERDEYIATLKMISEFTYRDAHALVNTARNVLEKWNRRD